MESFYELQFHFHLAVFGDGIYGCHPRPFVNLIIMQLSTCFSKNLINNYFILCPEQRCKTA